MFLIPFLRNRSHNESAHTFGSSHWFLEVPQKGFLNKMLVPHSATRLAASVTLAPHSVEYGVCHLLTPSSSPVPVLYCTVLYYTILYCNVLYFTVLYCTLPHCHIATLCWAIVSWHSVKTLCPDIVSRHCVCKLNVCSLLLGCKSRGWDPEGPKGPPNIPNIQNIYGSYISIDILVAPYFYLWIFIWRGQNGTRLDGMRREGTN